MSFAARAAAAERVRWKMQSAFPSSLTQLGTVGKRLELRIELVSGGDICLRFYGPNALAPALQIFDSVASGAIDAGWSTAGNGTASSFERMSDVPPAAPVRGGTSAYRQPSRDRDS